MVISKQQTILNPVQYLIPKKKKKKTTFPVGLTLFPSYFVLTTILNQIIMVFTLPTIDALKKSSYSQLSETIAHLFEPTSSLTNLIYIHIITSSSNASDKNHALSDFSTYSQFIENVRTLLLSLDIPADPSLLDPQIANIIGAHPRLGAKKVDSEQSQKEQASLNRSPQDLEKIRQLNNIYERTFPGLKYVVFVNARPLSVIADNMISRIDRNDFKAECKEAFNVSVPPS